MKLQKNEHSEAVFHYFKEISKIPRGSGNEKAISDYICDFARKHHLAYNQDEWFNVLVKKTGGGSCQTESPVLLQGHLDMVCEKDTASNHDFTKDGITVMEKDGYLCADGTTLGADNGIAVAMMLAILADDSLVHPPLECVFTVQEEIGLIGAQKLDGNLLKARTMINLDSEEEGVATVSCAGGLRIRAVRQINWAPAEHCDGIFIQINGLPGGHSGIDIHLERANANKLMARLLYTLSERFEFSLAGINGGKQDNAIPRECEAVLAVPTTERPKIQETLEQITADLQSELLPAHPQFQLNWQFVEAPERQFGKKDTEALLRLLYLAPDGVLKRNVLRGNFVIASANLGVVRTNADMVEAVFAPRSSEISLQKEIKQHFSLLGKLFGFSLEYSGEYPGWSYQECSKIRDIMMERYHRLFGKELRTEAIHAGLECGLFQNKLPGLDAIAIGPTILDCHTPKERLDIASCKRTWKLLVDVLERFANQEQPAD